MTAAVSKNENQRAAVWTPGMWRGCYVNIWHGVFLCRHGSKNEWAVIWTMGMRRNCYMNVWHVTKLFICEHLTCDEAVIWTSGMWRNCYMNAWRGFVLYHGCYKGRWNSATLMNFWPARPFSFAMFAVIAKNEGTIIWTSGIAFSFFLGIMPVSLFAAVLLFSIESVCCVWYLRCARKQGIRGQSRRSNTFYLYSKLPQTRV